VKIDFAVVALAAGIFLGASPSATRAQSIEEFRSADGLERTLNVIKIQGVVSGLGSANAVLVDRGEHPLYCEPRRLSLTSDQVINIVTNFIDDHPDLDADLPLSSVVVFAMEDVFPCPDRRPPFTGPVGVPAVPER
jgi:hypothetical protein